jgi:hypothetical protein
VHETPPTETTSVPGARVIIDDGPNAGRSATADSTGRYTLSDLVDSTFNLHASAPGYLDRGGGLVLGEDRVLNFQLAPEPRTVTEVVSGSIQNCNGAQYIVCYSHRFYMHHAGPIEIKTMTTTGESVDMRVQFYDANRDYIVIDYPHRSPGTMSLGFCTGCVPSAYDFRIVGRILGSVTLTATLTHPN